MLGICVHGINSEMEIQNELATAVPCGGQHHTAAMITAKTDEAITISNTDEEIFKRVSDNGSNMKAAWDKGDWLAASVTPLNCQLVELFVRIPEIAAVLAKS